MPGGTYETGPEIRVNEYKIREYNTVREYNKIHQTNKVHPYNNVHQYNKIRQYDTIREYDHIHEHRYEPYQPKFKLRPQKETRKPKVKSKPNKRLAVKEKQWPQLHLCYKQPMGPEYPTTDYKVRDYTLKQYDYEFHEYKGPPPYMDRQGVVKDYRGVVDYRLTKVNYMPFSWSSAKPESSDKYLQTDENANQTKPKSRASVNDVMVLETKSILKKPDKVQEQKATAPAEQTPTQKLAKEPVKSERSVPVPIVAGAMIDNDETKEQNVRDDQSVEEQSVNPQENNIEERNNVFAGTVLVAGASTTQRAHSANSQTTTTPLGHTPTPEHDRSTTPVETPEPIPAAVVAGAAVVGANRQPSPRNPTPHRDPTPQPRTPTPQPNPVVQNSQSPDWGPSPNNTTLAGAAVLAASSTQDRPVSKPNEAQEQPIEESRSTTPSPIPIVPVVVASNVSSAPSANTDDNEQNPAPAITQSAPEAIQPQTSTIPEQPQADVVPAVAAVPIVASVNSEPEAPVSSATEPVKQANQPTSDTEQPRKNSRVPPEVIAALTAYNDAHSAPVRYHLHTCSSYFSEAD